MAFIQNFSLLTSVLHYISKIPFQMYCCSIIVFIFAKLVVLR